MRFDDHGRWRRMAGHLYVIGLVGQCYGRLGARALDDGRASVVAVVVAFGAGGV